MSAGCTSCGCPDPPDARELASWLQLHGFGDRSCRVYPDAVDGSWTVRWVSLDGDPAVVTCRGLVSRGLTARALGELSTAAARQAARTGRDTWWDQDRTVLGAVVLVGAGASAREVRALVDAGVVPAECDALPVADLPLVARIAAAGRPARPGRAPKTLTDTVLPWTSVLDSVRHAALPDGLAVDWAAAGLGSPSEDPDRDPALASTHWPELWAAPDGLGPDEALSWAGTVVAWASAGMSPAEAAAVSALPDGHPSKPTPASLAAMRAMAEQGRGPRTR